ncbi:hypothetical protein MIR68_002521 [Amoeboaphelidium protococcarum]|nr:hypothetical protein MIR68_002521 [Amoeboaphelidium protococcarum]
MVFLSKLISGKQSQLSPNDQDFINTTVYGSRFAVSDVPKYEMPATEMPANVAYKLIKDELALDGNPLLNLASFVTTYMEEEAEMLMTENLSKNFIDFEEYPETADIHSRCVNIVANLFNAPIDTAEGHEAVGTSTIGSSEALMLSVLALKRRWQQRQEKLGKSKDKPNMIMGANVQVCVEKACRYFEIEARQVPCEEGQLCLDPHKAIELVDENTIGVVVILGSTYTGHFEDVKLMDKLLQEKAQKTGYAVPIHVDAASGGFVAPFTNPELEWDFRVKSVVSINVSGHKYGLAYPGVGWCIWRSKEYLPEDLVFHINYLGADQASFTLNFSKSAANVISQYYTFIRYGREGYKLILKNLVIVADHLAKCLVDTGIFEIISPEKGEGLPLVAWRIRPDVKKHWNEFDLAAKLREHSWIVPAYTMCDNVKHIKLCRVVVREDFTMSRCHILVKHINMCIKQLDETNKDALDAVQRKIANKWRFNASSWRHKDVKAAVDVDGGSSVC